MSDQDDLLAAPPLRWGILATGKVSNDFVQALKVVHTAAVVAVGARDPADAHKFLAKHSLTGLAGNYEEVCACTEVDAVYVGTLHPWHREHAEMALRHKKHVLVEKPMAMSRADAAAIYDAAEAAGRLVLEGMWTRFFPAVAKAAALLPSIAPVAEVRATFGVDAAADIGPHPGDTVFQCRLGGGAVTLLGPYLLQAALLGLAQHRDPSGARPRLVAAGLLDAAPPAGGGAELSAGATLTFPTACPYEGGGAPVGGVGGLAVLSCSLLVESAEEVHFVGSGGTVMLCHPAHCPTRVELRRKSSGRGASEVSVFEYPLPAEPETVASSGGFIMPNSIGFAYEAAAFARAVGRCEAECPEWTRADSLECLGLVDAWRDAVRSNAQAD